ncbi:dipeptide ABC transporter ATP-binding protein [Curvibacter gracilis]|uniref:dipeptide ABC transporter ATP-binding protein n=1 Tax=Curvibacter gracilis TaxID=230310 RepID=UPI0004AF1058|nr:ABC transporter ATP-binding protein [Curvibacter gracilis]
MSHDPHWLVDVAGLQISTGRRDQETRLVQNLSLQIAAGECVALVGESGSGKSLSARALLGLAGEGLLVQAERLQLAGENALNFSPRQWRQRRGTLAGLVMQDALVSLDPLRTIGQEVEETLLRHHLLPNRAAVRVRTLQALQEAGMDHPEQRASQYAHQLSGGLRQRALIAAAMAARPRLLIADEPTTALDATVQAQVLELLAQRVQEGIGLLLISHDLALVARMAQRVIVLRHGQVVDAGPTDQVLSRPRHAYTRQLLASVPSAASRGHWLASARAEEWPDGRVLIQRTALPSRSAGPAGQAAAPSQTSETSQEPLIRVQQVSKHFGSGAQQHSALQEVSFDLQRGEVLGIVGESGSGKSTCARILLGLQEPDSGQVLLQGLPWSGVAEPQRRALRPQLQYIPQDPLSSFDPRYDVARIVAENLPPQDKPARQRRLAQLLDQVGLPAAVLARHPRSLSGGQRQRVAIARALAAQPAAIVCDEPVSALDIHVQAQVLDLLTELRLRLGTALVFISHDLGVVQHISDRVLVFHQGRIVEQGEASALFAAPSHPYTRSLLAAAQHGHPQAPVALQRAA